MTQVNYKAIVTSAKKAARDVLRAEKVEALVGWIAGMTNRIAELNASVEADAKILAMAEYDLRVATEFNHPRLEEITKRTEEVATRHAEFKASVAESIKECEAKIEEYNTKIENWNNGTSKVDKDRLTALALEMVKNKIGADFNMGLYEAEAEATA